MPIRLLQAVTLNDEHANFIKPHLMPAELIFDGVQGFWANAAGGSCQQRPAASNPVSWKQHFDIG